MNENNELPPGRVPEGVQFGDRVLTVPSLFGGIFTHAGDVTPETSKTRSYAWVNRGDLIGTLWLVKRKWNVPVLGAFAGRDRYTAPILCPASGLIVHSTYQANGVVEFDDDPPTAAFALLLPDDEPKPVPGDVMFRDAANLIRNHIDVMLQPSPFWSMPPKSPERIEELLQTQLAANSRAYPALPRWQDYFDEARTRHPELRPHLKHLVLNW